MDWSWMDVLKAIVLMAAFTFCFLVAIITIENSLKNSRRP